MRSKLVRILSAIALGVVLGFPLSNLVRPADPLRSVVYVTNKEGTSGGTGFHVRAKSGEKYLVTNAHVCEGIEKDGEVYVRLATEDLPIPRHVLQKSPTTDLCLVEALPQAKPVEMAESDPGAGDLLTAIGHPKLFQMTETSGLVIGPRKITMLDRLIPLPGECDEPKHERKEIDILFFKVPACLIHLDAIQTTVVILPGSSGSPLFDEAGKVRGVAFGADSNDNWAAIVPVSDLREFLEHY